MAEMRMERSDYNKDDACSVNVARAFHCHFMYHRRIFSKIYNWVAVYSQTEGGFELQRAPFTNTGPCVLIFCTSANLTKTDQKKKTSNKV